MKEFKDLTGQKFNRLTVLELSDKTNKHKDRYWLCQCECKDKTIKSIREYHLIKGNIKSCGCLSREKTIESNKNRQTRNKYPYYKRIYSIYDGMRKRCYNENNDNYDRYGGRGITICNEWLSDFKNFYEWAINNGYQNNLTIDRIDNDGNYEPGNCRWATIQEQCYNKSNTVYITIDGETNTILEWSNIYNLPTYVLWQRYKLYGYEEKEELFKPLKKITKIIHNGKEKTLRQLHEETGIGIETLRKRYERGLKDDELIQPVNKNN